MDVLHHGIKSRLGYDFLLILRTFIPFEKISYLQWNASFFRDQSQHTCRYSCRSIPLIGIILKYHTLNDIHNTRAIRIITIKNIIYSFFLLRFLCISAWTEPHDTTTRHDTTRHDTTRHNTTLYDTNDITERNTGNNL